MFAEFIKSIINQVKWAVTFAVFIARGTFVAIADLILMYCYAGCVWLQHTNENKIDHHDKDEDSIRVENTEGTSSNEGLVVQLSAHSPRNSLVNGDDVILHINYDKIHNSLRGNWHAQTRKSETHKYKLSDGDLESEEDETEKLLMLEGDSITWAIVTGIGCGGIGFYTALHLLLCGINVCGVVQYAEEVREVKEKLMWAVTRQQKSEKAKLEQQEQQKEEELSCESTVIHTSKPHYSGALKVMACDLSNTCEVDQFVEYLIERNLAMKVHLIICNAGLMCCPMHLTPQNLESQFATHHVAHSLLLLRLLKHRIETVKTKQELFEDEVSSMRLLSRRTVNEEEECESVIAELSRVPPLRMVIVSSAALAACPIKQLTYCKENEMFHEWTSLEELAKHGPDRFDSYAYAKMCETLFALALSKFIASNNILSSSLCSVVIVHPGPIRSRVIPHSCLPLRFIIDGPVAALFRLSPVIAACYVVDVAISSKYYPKSTSTTTRKSSTPSLNGHYFRMGIDVTVQEQLKYELYSKRDSQLSGKCQNKGIEPHYGEAIIANPLYRWLRALIEYMYHNSTLYLGLPAPSLLLCSELQDQIWKSTVQYFDKKRLIKAELFLRKQTRKAKKKKENNNNII